MKYKMMLALLFCVQVNVKCAEQKVGALNVLLGKRNAFVEEIFLTHREVQEALDGAESDLDEEEPNIYERVAESVVRNKEVKECIPGTREFVYLPSDGVHKLRKAFAIIDSGEQVGKNLINEIGELLELHRD